jgi:hypothetical protein
MFGGKYMEFRIIFALQYSISINTFEVDTPSDSLYNAVVKLTQELTTFIDDIYLSYLFILLL